MSIRESSRETAFPDTPAGRIAERYVLYFHVDPDDFDFRANEKIFHPDLLERWPKWDDETRRKMMRTDREHGRGMKALAGVEVILDTEIAVVVDFQNNRTFRITLTLEPEPPHRITHDRWMQVYDFDLVLREATEADAAVLADIERRSPVVYESASIATDRGTDYFASARLMDDVTVIVAEVDGEPAGVSWGSGHTAIIKGEEVKTKYYFHLRIAPEHQKKGLWGALFSRLDDVYSERDRHFYGHFSLGNVAWKHVASQRAADVPRPGMWRPGVMRARLHSEDIAGPPAGRRATPADTERIVHILNAGRGREEMYVPYTVESFASRMSKDPSLYSWDRVLIGERAVVGVWPVGDKVRTIVTRDGITTESRPGYVLDYGFEPGAEDEFESLLRAWAGLLSSRGMNRMSILTSVGSLGLPIIGKLTDDVEQLVMNTAPPIEAPEDLASRGLYVDHIYF